MALCALVAQFESQFVAVASQMYDEEKNNPVVAAEAPGGWNVVAISGTGNHTSSNLCCTLYY